MLLALGLGAATGAPATYALDLTGAFESERERESGLPAKGFSATLSQGLGDYFSIGFSYSQLRTEPFAEGELEGREQYESAGANLGAGYAFSEAFAVSATGGYVQSEVRGLDGFENDPVLRSHGPSGSLTLSYWPHPILQFYAGPAYSYLGREPAWQGSVGSSLKLMHGVWLNASYWGAQSKDGWSAGLSFTGG